MAASAPSQDEDNGTGLAVVSRTKQTRKTTARAEKRARDAFLLRQARLAQAPLVKATAAGLGGTVGIILQSFALASVIYVGAVLRAGAQAVLFWLAVLAVAIALKAACAYAASWYGAQGGLRVQRALRQRLLEKLLNSERLVAEASAPQAAAHAQTFLEQVDHLEPYYARYLPQLWLAVLSPLLFLLVIFPTNWVVGVILLGTTPIIPVYMALIGLNAEERSNKHAAAAQYLSTYFLDRLRGLATLRRLGASNREVSRIEAVSEELGQRSMDVLNLALLSSSALEFFNMLSIAISAIYIGFTLLGFFHVGVPRSGMTLQTGMFLLLLAASYYQPLRAFAAAYHDRADALAAVERLAPLLAEEETTDIPAGARNIVNARPSPAHPGAPVEAAPAITLRHVTLRYEGQSQPALSDISLDIPGGHMFALIGPSGAGKSSVLALIAGLATPTDGKVAVGAIPVIAETLPNVRQSVSWIGQRPYLFPGTLAENIAFGQPDAPRSQIEEAARLARVLDFAEALPDGLDTRLGERGGGLSGGEAQRVALARAFLRDTPLLLLDEPTASLDPATERDVIATLLTLAHGRTVVIATHSPALIAQCQRVLRLSGGRLVETIEHSAPGSDIFQEDVNSSIIEEGQYV